MFDSNTTVIKVGATSHNVTFNAVGGTLIKSSPNSKIVRCGMTSELARTLMDLEEPHYIKIEEVRYDNAPVVYKEEIKVSIVILQVMLCGDSDLMIEFLAE